MQNKFFSSKLNSVLLLVLIVLMIIALRWMYQDKERYLPNNQAPAETLQFGEDDNSVVKDTYTYTNHGFSIELPKGFIPKETQSEGGPTIIISLPSGNLNYWLDAAWWEKYPHFSYVKDEKIGETTFKVYEESTEDGGHYITYWLKKGKVGYEFTINNSEKSKLENILETFRFVGWPQAQHYSKNGLSFDYSKDAKEKTLNGTFGPYHEIGIPGDNYYPDTLYFFKGEVPKDASMCQNVENKNMVINGKTFIYCDSKAEPYRTYIYKKDGKTVIVGTMLIGDEKMETYIDLGSIEIE